MRVLIIGGTGLISGAVTRELLARGDEVVHFNRGLRESAPAVEAITGNRHDHAAFETRLARESFDAAIDMVCYDAGDARSAVRALAGRTLHFIVCSSVCVYGADVPHNVYIGEDHAHDPVSRYASGKAEAESVFREAYGRGDLPVTIMRPTRVYGPTAMVRHNTGAIDSTWDRLEHGLPVLCSGDGLGLFQPCHCDEVAKAFAYALGRESTVGQAYNVAHRDVITWREFYGRAAAAMGQPARLLYAPAAWIIARNPERFNELKTIFQHHGVYATDKIRRDVPEFRHWIPLEEGLHQALRAMKARGEWQRWQDDEELSRIIRTVENWGVHPDTVDYREATSEGNRRA